MHMQQQPLRVCFVRSNAATRTDDPGGCLDLSINTSSLAVTISACLSSPLPGLSASTIRYDTTILLIICVSSLAALSPGHRQSCMW
jgi:hypothetical protein